MSLASPAFCDHCGAANRAQAMYCRVCGRSLSPSGVQASVPSSVSSTLTGTLTRQHLLKQRYIILGPAGKGGFGAVYKATDTLFANRVVAVKEMSQNNLDANEMVNASQAFRREAMLLAGLTHPNLPRIYEQFTDTGRSYLVMDFIEGVTLEEHLNTLQGRRLPVDRALDIALQLCSVLDYLHTRQPPIIFRDLKPANVMLTHGGHVYLIDFGIARHFKPGQSKDTTALGSTGYAAPEQYGRSQTTARADIYSLGATLHQLVSGDDPTEVPFQFAQLRLPHPTLAGLDILVMSMVNVDVTKRPASIAHVRLELQRIMTNYATSGSIKSTISIPLPYQPPQLPPQVPTSPKPSIRKPTTSKVPFQPNTLYVCTGHTSRITALGWSPDGKRLASASYDKTVRIWDAISGIRELIYKRHRGRVNALAWSPDSTLIATASDDATVHVWEVATGNLRVQYTGHSGPINALAWSPDGQYVASAGEDMVVQIWQGRQGTPLFAYRGHSKPINTLAWAPDSKHVGSAGEDHKVHTWELYKDQQQPQKRGFLSNLTSLLSGYRKSLHMIEHTKIVNSLAWSPDGTRIASVGSDKRTIIWNWDQQSNELTTSYSIESQDVKMAIAWAPKSPHLTIGGTNKDVEIWNVNKTGTNKLISTYRGHTNTIATVAWSPDGTRIASAGIDRVVHVWQVK